MRFTARETTDKCTRIFVPTTRNQCSLQDMEAVTFGLRRTGIMTDVHLVEDGSNKISMTVPKAEAWDDPRTYPHKILEDLAELHEGRHGQQLQLEPIAAAA